MENGDRRGEIRALVSGYSLEVTPGAADGLGDLRAHLRPGTTVAVTHLPGSDFRDTVRVAKRLRAEGFEPAPHVAARSLRDRAELSDYVARLTGEAGVRHVVVMAGSVARPVGELTDSMQMLDTGVFERHGVEVIGVAGHPEGNPDIPEEVAARALAWKDAYSGRTDARLYICTQFVFEAAPLVAWIEAIRSHGIQLPVRVGVPGPATVKTLLRYARMCGIGPSMRFLTRKASPLARTLTVGAPDRLIADLARYTAENPGCGVEGVHLYPFGALDRSAGWAYAVVDGDFSMGPGGRGFVVRLPT